MIIAMGFALFGLAVKYLPIFPEQRRAVEQGVRTKTKPVAATAVLSHAGSPDRVKEVLRYLKTEARPGFLRLDDLTTVDESARRERQDYPDYTLIYQLLSFESASRVRLQVPLAGPDPSVGSITDIWPAANWYEREVFDMFGIRFQGDRRLWRLVMPDDWEGYPCGKATPTGPPRWPRTPMTTPRSNSPWTRANIWPGGWRKTSTS